MTGSSCPFSSLFHVLHVSEHIGFLLFGPYHTFAFWPYPICSTYEPLMSHCVLLLSRILMVVISLMFSFSYLYWFLFHQTFLVPMYRIYAFICRLRLVLLKSVCPVTFLWLIFLNKLHLKLLKFSRELLGVEYSFSKLYQVEFH